MPDIDEPEEGPEAELDVQAASIVLDQEDSDRMFLDTILPFIDSHARDRQLSERVQFSVDQMLIAICERAARIAGNDLPSVEDL